MCYLLALPQYIYFRGNIAHLSKILFNCYYRIHIFHLSTIFSAYNYNIEMYVLPNYLLLTSICLVLACRIPEIVRIPVDVCELVTYEIFITKLELRCIINMLICIASRVGGGAAAAPSWTLINYVHYNTNKAILSTKCSATLQQHFFWNVVDSRASDLHNLMVLCPLATMLGLCYLCFRTVTTSSCL